MSVLDRSATKLWDELVGESFRDDHCDVLVVWAAITRWIADPAEGTDLEEDWLCFECGLRPAPGKDVVYPESPAYLAHMADTPLSYMTFLWDFKSQPLQGEIGVELWFSADSAWQSFADIEGWDRDHSIGFHEWGRGGEKSGDYVEFVEATPMFQLAAQRRCILARMFGDGFERIARNSDPPS